MAEQDKFSLDEIMREFGGWTQRDDPSAESVPEAAPEPSEPSEPAAQPTHDPLEDTRPIDISEAQPDAQELAPGPEPVLEQEPEIPEQFPKLNVQELREQILPEAEPSILTEPPERPEHSPLEDTRPLPPRLQFMDLETAKATLPSRAAAPAAEEKQPQRKKKKKHTQPAPKKEADPVPQEKQPEERPEKPERLESPERPEKPEKAEKERPNEPPVEEDATVIPLFAEPASDDAEEPEPKAEAPEAPEQPPKREKKPRSLSRLRRKSPDAEQPERVPQEVYQKAVKAAGRLHLRLLFVIVLTVVSAALTLGNAYFSASLPFLSNASMVSGLLLGLLLATMLLCYDVLIRGVVSAAELRFDLETLALLASLVTVLDGVFSLRSGRVAYYSVMNLTLLCALFGAQHRLDGEIRSLKAVMNASAPASIELKADAWKDGNVIFRGDGTYYGFVDSLETTDGAERAMRVLSPILLVVSLLLAMVSAGRSERSLLWTWSGILGGSIPVMGFGCYARPFAKLAARLMRTGAALCGWDAAKALGRASYLTVQDADLFPKSNITQNGVKVYEGFRLGQVVAYAATVAMAAGSGLTPLLENEMRNYGVHEYPVGNFRRYEGGGYGAEVCGDVVLMGSRRFLQLMGIRFEEGSTELRSALYVSINGTVAGLFALTYAPSSAVRAALHMVLRSRSLLPLIATRDCMLTLSVISAAYRLSQDDLEYPTAEERSQLATMSDGRMVGLLTRDSFLPYTETVAGGATLHHITRTGIGLAVLSSLLGVFLLAFLLAFGAAGSVAAVNVLLYSAVWIIPNLLIQSWIGRF